VWSVKTAHCNSKIQAQHTSTVAATWWAAGTPMQLFNNAGNTEDYTA